MLNSIMHLIYPVKCVFCDRVSNEYICKKCNLKLYNILNVNIEKIQEDKNYKELAYVFEYKDIIRELIIKYKFLEHVYIYKAITKIIVENKKICNFLNNYDTIIPVPMSKKKKRKRGYNQTELIVKEMKKYRPNLNIELDVLIKKKETKTQSTLTKKERMNNIKDAYEAKNIEKVLGKKVLIIDDIYTTGSTVNECSKILKEAGVSKIGVLAIAKD